MKWSEIYEGWRNKLLPPSHLKRMIEDVATLRMDVCRECKHNSRNKEERNVRPDEYCTICKCTLSAKTRCLACNCPLLKWKAVITKKQQEEIDMLEDGREIQNSESAVRDVNGRSD